MKEHKPYIVFSTFNNSVTELVKYASDYVVYDQSDIDSWKQENQKFKAKHRKNVGHSLGNIFEFIINNWEDLPDTVTFLKANVVPRHCNLEYLEKNINNGFYSHFYNESDVKLKSGVNEVLFPGFYLEINNSWYMAGGNHALFCSYDELASSIFQNYVRSNHILFGPGACFTVTSAQIRKHPKALYELLEFIVSYKFFPEEAYIVERIFPMIFFGTYDCNRNLEHLLEELKRKLLTDSLKCVKHPSPKIFNRILEKLIRHNR